MAKKSKVHRFSPKKFYCTFGRNTPALTVNSGDTVVAITVDAGNNDHRGEILPASRRQKVRGAELYESNPLVGPICVEGAEIGDTLAVEIKEIKLNRPTAYSRIAPHFGSFTGELRNRRLLLNEPMEEKYYHWRIDLKRNVGILELPESKLGKVEVSLHPFLGSIGVAPPYGRAETSLTPGEYGGNMDCVETKEGTTLHLPVFARGAYFAFGDVHAAQGDGEICGVALETTAEVTIKLRVIKGEQIEWPRLEDETHIMVAGSGRPLWEAFKIAHVELINWLVCDYGFTKYDAIQLTSQVGAARVGNVVDPNFTVVAKFPRKYLPE